MATKSKAKQNVNIVEPCKTQVSPTDKDDKNYDKCGVCNLVVCDNDKALSCKICETWYHISCENFPDDVYKFMVESEARKQHCSFCQRGCTKLYKHIQNITTKESEIDARQDAMEEEAGEIKSAIEDKAENRLTESQLGTLEARELEISEKLDEILNVSEEFKDLIQATKCQGIGTYLKQSQNAKATHSEAGKVATDRDSGVLNEMVQTKVSEAAGQSRIGLTPSKHVMK